MATPEIHSTEVEPHPHPFDWHILRFTHRHRGSDSLNLVSSYPGRPPSEQLRSE
jgi:hypothetical protein